MRISDWSSDVCSSDLAQCFPTTKAALADLHRVYATTARPRGMVKSIVTPAQAAVELRRELAAGHRAGLLFGPERSGLVNDDIALAHAARPVRSEETRVGEDVAGT